MLPCQLDPGWIHREKRADVFEKMLDQSVVGCQLSVQKNPIWIIFSKKKGWPPHISGAGPNFFHELIPQQNHAKEMKLEGECSQTPMGFFAINPYVKLRVCVDNPEISHRLVAPFMVVKAVFGRVPPK